MTYIYELSINNSKIHSDVYNANVVENGKFKKLDQSDCEDIVIKETDGMVVYYLIQSDKSEAVLCAIPK